MNKIPLLLGILSLIIYRVLFYFTDNIWLSLSIFLVPVGLLIFNLSVRKRLSFSGWFLSTWNFFLERVTHSFESELEAELLYAKFLEVAEDSKFRLLDTNENKLQLLLGTSAGFFTWGENVYIRITSSTGGSRVEFVSVTLFGNTSWKSNDKNFGAFIKSFESSLTI